MIAGELYNAMDPELVADRNRAKRLSRDLLLAAPEDHQRILSELVVSKDPYTITPPFNCDYGYNIRLGSNVYFNFGCVLLDVGEISIGSDTLIGPGVHIYTAMHPMDADERRTGIEFAKPVAIGKDCWIGGSAVICPGVTIGDRCIIGAGSVVTRDIPAGSFAAGNPCRVIRSLEASK